ncbi:MAG: hypothetical protein GX425_18350 [Peptococcaceae bacterium]|nr:hypothetical protein [Peptococcaceae bacterium]
MFPPLFGSSACHLAKTWPATAQRPGLDRRGKMCWRGLAIQLMIPSTITFARVPCIQLFHGESRLAGQVVATG